MSKQWVLVAAGLWLVYTSAKLAYEGIVKKRLPSGKIGFWLPGPRWYYAGWRAVRAGALNLIGALACASWIISLVTEVKAFEWAGLLLLLSIVLASIVILILDPPTRHK